jgi:hypothetical protein
MTMFAINDVVRFAPTAKVLAADSLDHTYRVTSITPVSARRQAILMARVSDGKPLATRNSALIKVGA